MKEGTKELMFNHHLTAANQEMRLKDARDIPMEVAVERCGGGEVLACGTFFLSVSDFEHSSAACALV